jgi:hypothetical protein
MQCKMGGSSGVLHPATVTLAQEMNFTEYSTIDPITNRSLGGTSGLVETGRPLYNQAECLPSLFVGHLVFANGSVASQIGGAVWTKSQATWLLGCCHLTRGNMVQAGMVGFEGPRSRSTATICAFGDDNRPYDRSLHVFYNHINDGSMDLLPNPTVYAGAASFYPNTLSAPSYGEYTKATHFPNTALNYAHEHRRCDVYVDVPGTKLESTFTILGKYEEDGGLLTTLGTLLKGKTLVRRPNTANRNIPYSEDEFKVMSVDRSRLQVQPVPPIDANGVVPSWKNPCMGEGSANYSVIRSMYGFSPIGSASQQLDAVCAMIIRLPAGTNPTSSAYKTT